MNGNTTQVPQYPPQQYYYASQNTLLPPAAANIMNNIQYSSYDQTSTTQPPEKWGTSSHHVMMGAGAPGGVAAVVPTYNVPNNPKASLWSSSASGSTGSSSQQYQHHHMPYIQYSPVEKPTNTCQMESVLHKFNYWGNKANTTANNIWHNLKTGSSVSGSAWDKVNVTAKAITEGGFESLYKQSFATFPNEKLNKSFACYLSTSTGPVAGTLYLSNLHIAFCSDTPISFTSSPSGHQTWSYYKVMAPLGKIGTINPVVMRDKPSEKYIQIATVDGHDFWFMGFVNYEKASRHLTQSICNFVASGIAVPYPAVA